MINYLKTTALLLLLLYTSCNKKEVPEEIDIFYGKVTALLNGETWGEAKIRTSWSYGTLDTITININTQPNGIDNITVGLSINKRAFTKGVSMMSPSIIFDSCTQSCTNFNTSFGGDLAVDHYLLLMEDSFEDWIAIDSIDTETLEYWGRFQASFVIDDNFRKLGDYPDTIYLENAVFNGKVIER